MIFFRQLLFLEKQISQRFPTRQLRYRTVPYTDNYDGRFTLVCRAMYTASSYRLKPAQILCQLKKEKIERHNPAGTENKCIFLNYPVCVYRNDKNEIYFYVNRFGTVPYTITIASSFMGSNLKGQS